MLMQDSLITIVIPVYNRAHILMRTLQSVADQTVAPVRVILVDNNSTDDSMALMKRWASEHPGTLVLSEKKPGAAAARNCGLSLVATEFVMFFDSDDVMLPNHVADFAEAIRCNPDVDIFGRSISLKFIDGTEGIGYFASKKPMFNHLFRGCLSTQRMVVRTSLVRSAGAWNPDMLGWNDFELGVRLLLNTDKIINIGGKPSVIAYQLKESITGTDFASKSDIWEASLNEVRENILLSGRTKELVWVDARAMILAAHYEREARLNPDTHVSLKTHARAVSLRQRILALSDHPHRMHLIYLHNLYLRRLSWVFAMLLFPFAPRN